MSTAGHAELFAPPAADSESRKNLVGLDRAELTAELQQVGEPAFRARQLWHWIYHRGLTDFAAMTTLSKDFRARLAAQLPGFGILLQAALGRTRERQGCQTCPSLPGIRMRFSRETPRSPFAANFS